MSSERIAPGVRLAPPTETTGGTRTCREMERRRTPRASIDGLEVTELVVEVIEFSLTEPEWRLLDD